MNNFFFYENTNFFINFTNFLKSRERTNAEVAKSVSSIIDDVKVNKDFAVMKYTKRFDNINLDSKGFFYKPIEIKESIDKCSSKDKDAIELSISRILEFHKKQMPSNVNWKDNLGIELGWMWKPIRRTFVKKFDFCRVGTHLSPFIYIGTYGFRAYRNGITAARG